MIPNDTPPGADDTPLLPRPTTFNGPALLPVVQMWARTTTDPESATRTAIERVKTNVVMGCLNVCHKPPAHITPQDIQAY